MNELAIATDTPIVVQQSVGGILAHGVPAQQHRLDRGQCGAFLQIDLQPAVELASGKQNGFLGQPVEMPAGADFQSGLYAPEIAGGAIAALAGLGG